MKRTHWLGLGIVVAGLALLAGCSGNEPSQESIPDAQIDRPSDAGSTDTAVDAGGTATVTDADGTATAVVTGGTDMAVDQGRDQPLSGCLSDSTVIALVNGVILTIDATDSQASSVLLEGSPISAVGDSITVPDGACVVDLAGRTVVPGFIDSHVHFTRDWVWPGYFLWQIEDARSTQGVLDGIRERVESVPHGDYIIVVGGYPTNAFDFPTLAALERQCGRAQQRAGRHRPTERLHQ